MTDFFTYDTFIILKPYLTIGGFSGILFYTIYYIFSDSGFDFLIKFFCIGAYMFILVLLFGHIYYLSGLFKAY